MTLKMMGKVSGSESGHCGDCEIDVDDDVVVRIGRPVETGAVW